MRRPALPQEALDYPSLPDQAWVVWSSNGVPWPRADRRLFYLSKTQRDLMKGYALFTMNHEDAMVFPTMEEAHGFVQQNEVLRGRPYYTANITTVERLKELCGFKNKG